MAWLRKLPSGNWSAQVDCQGVRTSKTWDTKAKARAWATQIEAEIIARSRGQIVRRSLRQAFDRYGGTKWERTRLAFLAGSLGFADKWLEDVTPDDFGLWRDRCMVALKGSTVNRDLNLMMAVLSRCRDEWGWLHKSPLTKFKRPKDPPPRTRVIHWTEVRAVLRALGWSRTPPTTLQHEVGFAFLLSLHTSMRAGEVLTYRLNGRVARLEKTKNGDARDVPLSPRALRLHAMCPAYKVTSGSLDALFRKARKRAGLDGFTFHDARATAITRLSRRVDILTLARITGHRDPKTLMVYYRTTPEQIAGLLR